MFSWLKRGRNAQPAAEVPPFVLAEIPGAIERAGDIPYLNWEVLDAWVSSRSDHDRLASAYHCEIQRQWVDELADVFGQPYLWAEAGEIILLTARPPGEAKDLLSFAERCYRATKETVGPPASMHGKLVVLCFATQGHMYDYLAPMDAEGSYGGVGGFCVQEGSPYIALPDLPDSLEVTLLHEMTHACLGEDVPAWLQEGVAQLVEERLTRRQRLPMEERQIRRHRHHWSKRGLQAFWEGRSFKDADRGQALSYELAYVLVSILVGDHREALPGFLRAATRSDVGAAASEDYLGISLGELAAMFLGPGQWEPAPSSAEPVERAGDGVAE
jgi:hypothetical protein